MTTFTIKKSYSEDALLKDVQKEGIEEIRDYCVGNELVTLKGGKSQITIIASDKDDIENIKDIIGNYGLNHTVA